LRKGVRSSSGVWSVRGWWDVGFSWTIRRRRNVEDRSLGATVDQNGIDRVESDENYKTYIH
jgi:hypothetical protein